MNIADEDRIRSSLRAENRYFLQPSSSSFSMKDPHDTKDIMTGLSFDLKIIPATDVRKKLRIRRSADGGQMDFHLDAADIVEFRRIDEPFCTLTIAFYKITSAAHLNKVFEGVRAGDNTTVIPADLRRLPVAKGTFYYLYGSIVCPDIFTERMRGHRLHGGDMPAFFCSTDTEPADIGANVKDTVFLPDIIKPVLGYGGYLAIRLCTRGKNNIRCLNAERVVWHPVPLQTKSCLLSDKGPVMEHIAPNVRCMAEPALLTVACALRTRSPGRTLLIMMEQDETAHENMEGKFGTVLGNIIMDCLIVSLPRSFHTVRFTE